MNVALLELCRELYELSGWGDGSDMNKLKWLDYYDDWSVPAYDLGYLLRKLPSYIEQQGNLDGIDRQRRVAFQIRKWERPEVVWFAEYHEIYYRPLYRTEADTPEDAACKLAIELFKQGILKKEAS